MNAEKAAREFTFTESDFRFLSALVHEQTGIVLAEHKRDMVYSRLTRRLRALSLDEFSDYIDYLKTPQGSDELGPLVNAITTNLTSFFREEHHFDHLREQVIAPLLARNSAAKRLRIWSAGSSTGAEAYSIAMVAHDLLKKQKGWDIKILATDIDTNVLQHGISGLYRLTEMEHIPTRYRHYCAPVIGPKGEAMHIQEPVTSLVHFRHLNLLEAWPMKGLFDIIFCRNVVIYFDKPTQRVLFARFADHLIERGFLYIGHSENLFAVCDRFNLIGKTIYQKRGKS